MAIAASIWSPLLAFRGGSGTPFHRRLRDPRRRDVGLSRRFRGSTLGRLSLRPSGAKEHWCCNGHRRRDDASCRGLPGWRRRSDSNRPRQAAFWAWPARSINVPWRPEGQGNRCRLGHVVHAALACSMRRLVPRHRRSSPGNARHIRSRRARLSLQVVLPSRRHHRGWLGCDRPPGKQQALRGRACRKSYSLPCSIRRKSIVIQ
jgi:hypothetical protein